MIERLTIAVLLLASAGRDAIAGGSLLCVPGGCGRSTYRDSYSSGYAPQLFASLFDAFIRVVFAARAATSPKENPHGTPHQSENLRSISHLARHRSAPETTPETHPGLYAPPAAGSVATAAEDERSNSSKMNSRRTLNCSAQVDAWQWQVIGDSNDLGEVCG